MELKLRREAEQEIEEAYVWYEQEQAGRGRRFIDAVDSAFEHIREAPHTFPRWSHRGDVRYAVVPSFPYKVIFRSEPDAVRVYAVAHDRRRASYWRKRTSL
ncbi:MAG: type II toxin-antitoxin system RelE/ParE family toxin [Polyangiaceae bacterium]